jgi:hypothetical protein
MKAQGVWNARRSVIVTGLLMCKALAVKRESGNGHTRVSNREGVTTMKKPEVKQENPPKPKQPWYSKLAAAVGEAIGNAKFGQ